MRKCVAVPKWVRLPDAAGAMALCLKKPGAKARVERSRFPCLSFALQQAAQALAAKRQKVRASAALCFNKSCRVFFRIYQEHALEQRMVGASARVGVVGLTWSGMLTWSGLGYRLWRRVVLPGTGFEQPQRSVLWRRTCGSICWDCCRGPETRETKNHATVWQVLKLEVLVVSFHVRPSPRRWFVEVHRRTSTACGRRASRNRRQHMHPCRRIHWQIHGVGFFWLPAQVRQQLKADNYKAGRISQLLKATRPNPEEQTTTQDQAGSRASTCACLGPVGFGDTACLGSSAR